MSDYVLHSAQGDACDIDGTHPLTEREGKEDGNSAGEAIAYTEDEASDHLGCNPSPCAELACHTSVVWELEANLGEVNSTSRWPDH